MNFETLDEIKNLFVKGGFDLPDTFSIGGVTYRRRSSSSYTMEEMMLEGLKGVVVYSTPDASLRKHKEEVEQIGLNNWIIFLWSVSRNFSLVPYDVKTTNVARGSLPIREGENGDNFIGSAVEIRITNLPGGVALKGKVDTGADVCSLHAVEWSINNGNVSFKCPELSQNVMTMPLADQQAVKSADGGVEYRPVIELNVRVNGKLLNGVMFNLNDRGKMEYPVLVGRNALQAGKFKIDPSMDEGYEDIDWSYIQEQVQNDEVPMDALSEVHESIKAAIDTLQNIIEN